MSRSETPAEWSKTVAALAVDAFLTAGLLKREDLDKAEEIVTEEIEVRLALKDYPPDA